MPAIITRKLTVQERINLINELAEIGVYFHGLSENSGEYVERTWPCARLPYLFCDTDRQFNLCGYPYTAGLDEKFEPYAFLNAMRGVITLGENCVRLP